MPPSAAPSPLSVHCRVGITLTGRWFIPSFQIYALFPNVASQVGTELRGKTLGIVGMGAIGQRVGHMATAIGMTVIGVRSSSSRQQLEQLLSTAHVVSLHCPLTDSTRHLLGAAELELMRDDALLLNMARGAVVNKAALQSALVRGGRSPHCIRRRSCNPPPWSVVCAVVCTAVSDTLIPQVRLT
jgi:hypothetical protein